VEIVLDTNERNILTTTCFGHFMSHFNMLVFPALVIPLTGRYGMDMAQVLALSFWMYLLFGITALPWGLLTDRFGAKPLLFLFYTGAGLCGLGAALSLDSPGIFSLCLAGVGLFSGIYHPAGLGLISRGISRMSLALGYNGMAGNTGLAAAPLLAGIVNHQFGARAVYFFLAGLNIMGVFLMLALRCLEPEKREKKETGSDGSLITGFVILCACMMLGGIAYRATSVILPSYFELKNPSLFDLLTRVQWLPASKNVAATALTSLVYVVGIFGQYLGGRMADRFTPLKGYLVFHAVTIPMALAMAYTTDVPLVIVTMGYLFFLLGMQPIENTLVAVLTPDRLRHSAFGTKFVLTFGVGSLAVHLLGWIKGTWTLSAVFMVMSGVALALVISILLLMQATRNLRRR
jgi:MFS family permease